MKGGFSGSSTAWALAPAASASRGARTNSQHVLSAFNLNMKHRVLVTPAPIQARGLVGLYYYGLFCKRVVVPGQGERKTHTKSSTTTLARTQGSASDASRSCAGVEEPVPETADMNDMYSGFYTPKYSAKKALLWEEVKHPNDTVLLRDTGDLHSC